MKFEPFKPAFREEVLYGTPRDSNGNSSTNLTFDEVRGQMEKIRDSIPILKPMALKRSDWASLQHKQDEIRLWGIPFAVVVEECDGLPEDTVAIYDRRQQALVDSCGGPVEFIRLYQWAESESRRL